MAAIFSKLLITIAAKLVTESFLSKILVYGLSSLSKSTENKLDDKIVAAVATSLSVKID